MLTEGQRRVPTPVEGCWGEASIPSLRESQIEKSAHCRGRKCYNKVPLKKRNFIPIKTNSPPTPQKRKNCSRILGEAKLPDVSSESSFLDVLEQNVAIEEHKGSR